MLALKRLWLVIFVLVAPLLLTALLYWAAHALLAVTNRVIDAQIVDGAAVIEFGLFFVMSVLDAKNRWSA